MSRAPAPVERAATAERVLAPWRLLGLGLVGAIYYGFMVPEVEPFGAGEALLGASFLFFSWLLLARAGDRHPSLLRYHLISGFEGAALAGWLVVTGGPDSPFFPLWYLWIISIALRYSTPTAGLAALLAAGVSAATFQLAQGRILAGPEMALRVGLMGLSVLVGAVVDPLYERMLRSRAGLDALVAVTRSLAEPAALNVTLPRILRSALRVLRADRGAIYLLDPGSGALVCAHAEGLSEEYLVAISRFYRDLPGAATLSPGRIVEVQDASRDERMSPLRDAILRERIRSILVLPLQIEGRSIGVLALHRSRVQPFGHDELELAQSLATQTAIAIEHVRLLERLGASEAHYRLLAEHATDMISRIAPRGDILYASPATEGLLGYDPASLVGRSLRELVHPNDLQRAMDGHARLMEGPETLAIEYRMTRRNDTTVWVETTGRPVRDPDGRVRELITVTRDVTERKEAEEALRESENRFRTIFENSTIGIYRSHPDGRLMVVNPAVVRMLAYDSPEELTSRRLGEEGFYPPGYSREAWLERINREDEIIGLESAWTRKDGSKVWVRESARAIRDEEGRVLYFEGVIEDITARKRAEEELRRTSIELERTNRELEQFASIASHDLKEPLRRASSYLQLLDRRARGRLDAETGRYVERAIAVLAHMDELVSDLLALSAAGGSRGPPRPVDLEPVFQRVLEQLDASIQESAARITKEPLPIVMGDPTHLQQLLQNLLSNAIKFRRAAAPEIHVAVRRQGHEWLLSVRDNGIGIRKEQWERIFEPFHRLHTRDEYPGTGIGLAICKKIVETHGGRIWVDSKPGHGSTLNLTLPAAETL